MQQILSMIKVTKKCQHIHLEKSVKFQLLDSALSQNIGWLVTSNPAKEPTVSKALVSTDLSTLCHNPEV
jgi:hypothetical protein